MTNTNSILKKALSLVLSIVFAISSFTVAGFSALTADVAKADSNERFLMAYFTGNLQTEQQIKFAVSTDGSNFKPLYGGNAVLQEKSTDTNNYNGYTYTDGVRDPYIFDGHDGYYYCIATDLEATAYGFWGNQSQMVLWRSKDLINWSDAYYINVAQICNAKRGTTFNNDSFQRTWAPEVFYENGQYMIYFALAGGDYQATRMHYMITDDLFDWTHYSAPQVLYDPGYDDIDADIIKEGDTYYMFYKDETPGRSTVCLATASDMTGPYTFIGQFDTSSATGGIEGCEVYTVGNNYYLVADRFGAAGNFAIYNMGTSLEAVANASTNQHISVTSSPISTVEELYGFTNLTPRHGSIMHISEAQYNALVAASGGVTDDDIMYNFTKAYSRTSDGWAYENTYADSCLHDLSFMFKENGSSVKIAHDAGYATLRNSTIFCNDETVRAMLPDDIYTVSFDYSLESTTNLFAPIFALGTGIGAPSENTDYVMIFGNGDMWVRKSGESSDTFVANKALALGVTYHYDVVSDGTNITFYRDGEKIGQIAATVDFPSSGTRYAAFGFTDGHSSSGYGYGSYSRIRFRNRAVSASEINAESNASLIWRKDNGTETIGNMDNAMNVSHSGNHNTVDPIISRTAASYTLSGWVNPGESIDYNSVVMALGSGKWFPGPYGRYFAVREDGTILFNYCSGSNSGGNWSQHYAEVASAFSLEANTWAYLQVNVIPISDNQVKVVVYKDGAQTAAQDISLTTIVDNNNTDGNDYAYGILGMLQLPTNNIYLGRLEIPSWWQNENGTTYVKDVRFYAQAKDFEDLYAEALANKDAVAAREYVRANLESYDVEAQTNAINTGSTKRKAYHYESECIEGYSNVLAQTAPSGTDHISTTFAGNATVGNNTYNIFWPAEIALLYDGVHKTAMPAVLEVKGNGSMTTLGINQDSGKSPDWRFDHYWTGPTDAPWYDNIWKEWPGQKYAYTTTFVGDYPTTENGGSASVTDGNAHIGYHWGAEYDWQFNSTNSTRFFWNQCNYVGAGNTSTYYDHYDTMYARAWQSSERTIPNCTHHTYVINYKPVYDILKSGSTVNVPNENGNLLTVYNSVKDNESAYTADSLNQFYYAAYKLLTSNPVDYSESEYRANFAGTSAQAASEIKQAVNAFNRINLEERASFTDLDDAAASAQDILDNSADDYTADTIADLQDALDFATMLSYDANERANMSAFEYQSTIDEQEDAINDALAALVAKIVITYDRYSGNDVIVKFEPGASASDVEAAAPALTAPHFTDNKHYAYEWDKAFAIANANTTYTETRIEVPHNWTYTYLSNNKHTSYCNVPGFEHSVEEDCSYTSVYTSADGNSNGYTTYTCQYCGNTYVEYDAQGFTKYNDAVAEYESIVESPSYEDYYTADSRTAYEAAVAAALIDTTDKTISQSAINTATQAISNAKSLLVVQDLPNNTYNLDIDENVNVEFDIDTDYYEAKGATKVRYSYITTTDDKSAERTEQVVDIDSLDDSTKPGDNRKEISLVAAPAQIAEKYTVEMLDDNDVVVGDFETSIEDYCNAILSGDFSQEDKDLAQALLNYGALADEYFNYASIHADANNGEAYSISHSDNYKANVDAESFRSRAKASFVSGVDASGEAVSITNVSYVALIDPEFRFYISQENEVFAAMTDVEVIEGEGLTAEMVKTDNGFCVRVKGLKSTDFAKIFKIKIGTSELTYNGYAYLYTVLRSSSDSGTSLKDLAKGIYRYAVACEAKFA